MIANQAVTELCNTPITNAASTDIDLEVVLHALQSMRRGIKHYAACQSHNSFPDTESMFAIVPVSEAPLSMNEKEEMESGSELPFGRSGDNVAPSMEQFAERLLSYLHVQIRAMMPDTSMAQPLNAGRGEGGTGHHSRIEGREHSQSQRRVTVQMTQATQNSVASFSDDSGDDLMDDSDDESTKMLSEGSALAAARNDNGTDDYTISRVLILAFHRLPYETIFGYLVCILTSIFCREMKSVVSLKTVVHPQWKIRQSSEK